MSCRKKNGGLREILSPTKEKNNVGVIRDSVNGVNKYCRIPIQRKRTPVCDNEIAEIGKIQDGFQVDLNTLGRIGCLISDSIAELFFFDGVMAIVDTQPTAFDKEKVVKQIEDYRDLVPEWALKKYEDTELTPEQIMELKEAVQKLENIFGDEITINQVIDFFVDFYIAQGDPDRVEKAELLTNEEAAKWKELKERDTAKKPVQTEDGMVCPICGSKAVPWSRYCDECDQKWWEEED